MSDPTIADVRTVLEHLSTLKKGPPEMFFAYLDGLDFATIFEDSDKFWDAVEQMGGQRPWPEPEWHERDGVYFRRAHDPGYTWRLKHRGTYFRLRFVAPRGSWPEKHEDKYVLNVEFYQSKGSRNTKVKRKRSEQVARERRVGVYDTFADVLKAIKDYEIQGDER